MGSSIVFPNSSEQANVVLKGIEVVDFLSLEQYKIIL